MPSMQKTMQDLRAGVQSNVVVVTAGIVLSVVFCEEWWLELVIAGIASLVAGISLAGRTARTSSKPLIPTRSKAVSVGKQAATLPAASSGSDGKPVHQRSIVAASQMARELKVQAEAPDATRLQLCRHYARGVCWMGDRCTFSHDDTLMRKYTEAVKGGAKIRFLPTFATLECFVDKRG